MRSAPWLASGALRLLMSQGHRISAQTQWPRHAPVPDCPHAFARAGWTSQPSLTGMLRPGLTSVGYASPCGARWLARPKC